MEAYKDHSYPSIGEPLRYERADGAIITMTVQPPVRLPAGPKSASTVPLAMAYPDKPPIQLAKVSPEPIRVGLSEMESTGNERASNLSVPQRPNTQPQTTNNTVFDHVDVGGKFTIFILFYGPEEYYSLHQRCLESIINTVPRERRDIRVGSNALNSKSLALLEKYVKSGDISKHYQHATNDYKYPVMREMFHDPSHPITTKWLLWFDDDSIADVAQDWLQTLSQEIVKHHKMKNAHMFGSQLLWTPNPEQLNIFKSRPWYQGRPLRNQDGKPSPDGRRIAFASGGFWALSTAAMKKADIPDMGTGLAHNGGDWQIGEQLWQSGFNLQQFNGKKQFVRASSVPRRGITTATIDKLRNSTIVQKRVTVSVPVKTVPPKPTTAVAAVPAQPKLRLIQI